MNPVQNSEEQERLNREALDFLDHQSLTEELVKSVRAIMEKEDSKQLQVKIRSLHAADVANLLEQLERSELNKFYAAAPWVPDAEVLIRLSNPRRQQLLSLYKVEKLAAAFNRYSAHTLVDVLDGLTPAVQRSILGRFSPAKKTATRSKLAADPYSAQRIMRDGCILAPQDMTVGDALQLIRQNAQSFPKRFYDLYVIDAAEKIVGLVRISSLLVQPKNTKLAAIMLHKVHTVGLNTDQEDIARLFTHYGLSSVPVLDENQEPQGIIQIDDILEVIEEEAEQDIFALGGVHVEPEITDSIWHSSFSRFPWLSINMFTALVSSLVVMLFKASIEKMVLLAVVIPIITSVGGNAATQSMTIAVRHLITNELNRENIVISVLREIWVGLINSVLLSGIMLGIAAIWFGDLYLGLVCSLAILINIFAASLAGVVIPFWLENQGFDPAISSPVFVTMVTDVVGFLSLLGLATLLLL